MCSGLNLEFNVDLQMLITMCHLLTLQALYQPPYSPYGVLSLCLPWKKKEEVEEASVNGVSPLIWISSIFPLFT